VIYKFLIKITKEKREGGTNLVRWICDFWWMDDGIKWPQEFFAEFIL